MAMIRQRLIKELSVPVITFGENAAARVRADRIKTRAKNMLLCLFSWGEGWFQLPILGRFMWRMRWQRYRLRIHWISFESMQAALKHAFHSGTTGIDSYVQSAPGFIDYAHTPEALESVLNTLRSWVQGKLWVVFGCGGNRDRKTNIDGSYCIRCADKVILTSDNPAENPYQFVVIFLRDGWIQIGACRD